MGRSRRRRSTSVPSWAARVALSLGASLEPEGAAASVLESLLALGPIDAAWVWSFGAGGAAPALLAARPDRPVEGAPSQASLEEGRDPVRLPGDAGFVPLAEVTGHRGGCFVRFAMPSLGALLAHAPRALEPRDVVGLRLLASRLRVVLLGGRAYQVHAAGTPAPPVELNESLEQGILELSSSHERLERSVRDREAQYRTLFERAPVSLWELDLTRAVRRLATMTEQGVGDLYGHLRRDGRALRRLLASVRVLAANQATLALFGARGPAELQPPSLFRIFGMESAGVFIDFFAGLHAGRTAFEHEVAARALDGRPVEVLIRMVASLADREGRRSALVSMTDITALKRAERSLAQTAESLSRSNLDLQHFAYAASHDLQEPLRAVAGFAELLADGYGDRLDDTAGQYLSYIVDAASRMQALFRDLLEYARIESRDAKLTSVPVDDLLREALTALKARLDETGGQVRAAGLPVVSADPVLLRQLFQNLVGNALKFCRGRRPDVEVTAVLARGRRSWTFAVRDNGIGLAPEDQERVFEVFRRAGPRDEPSGTGLGLALCKRIVDRHGGRIWLESTPGVGSVFYFTLPVVDADRR